MGSVRGQNLPSHVVRCFAKRQVEVDLEPPDLFCSVTSTPLLRYIALQRSIQHSLTYWATATFK